MIKKYVDIIKNDFINEDIDVLKKLMQPRNQLMHRVNFVKLLSHDISQDNISKEDALNVLLISTFYGISRSMYNSSSYLKKLYNSTLLESKMVRLLENEVKVMNGSCVNIPVTVFIKDNIDKLEFLDKEVKMKAIKVINTIFYKEFENIVVTDKQLQNCYYDKTETKLMHGYIRLNDLNDNSKYVLLFDKACEKCNSLYLNTKRLDKINDKYKGYKLQDKIIKRIYVEDNKENTDEKIDKNKFKENDLLYNDLLKVFSIDNLGQSLLTYNNIVSNKELLKRYNLMQRITLLFIGYLIKGNTFGADKIISTGEIGVSSDTILYKRLSENREMIQYLNQYESALNLIDPYVKDMIIKKLRIIGDKRNRTTNLVSVYREEFDGSNLSDESDIKKMGYSTSISREQRWNILKNQAVPKLGKAKVIGHLRFLIKMNRGKSSMSNAVNEWNYDVDRLEKI